MAARTAVTVLALGPHKQTIQLPKLRVVRVSTGIVLADQINRPYGKGSHYRCGHSRCLCVRTTAAINELNDLSTVDLSTVDQLKLSGKITKTAILRLRVDEIRQELEKRGLPSVGRKPELVEQLLEVVKGEIAAQENTSRTVHDEEHASYTTATVARIQADSAEEAATAVAQTIADVVEAVHAVPETTADGPVAPTVPSSEGTAAAAEAAQKSRDTHSSQEEPTEEPTAPTVPSSEDTSAAEAAQKSRGSWDSRDEDPTLETGLAVTWLGTSSGAPTFYRNNSCIAFRRPSETYLVDAGEGTFNQLQRANINPATIKRIFITHMHGDHCFGLLGVLRAISGTREGTEAEHQPVHVHGPPGVHEEVITAIRSSGTHLVMPLVVHQFNLMSDIPPRSQQDIVTQLGATSVLLTQQTPQQQYNRRMDHGYADSVSGNYSAAAGLTWSFRVSRDLVVTAAQLQHRVPCWGYVFQETTEANGSSPAGAREGGRKVVLLGDTCNSECIADVAAACDVLSHEATFARGMENKAEIAQHSTAGMAGAFAKRIGAKQLVLTHFSARYAFRGRPSGQSDDPDEESEEQMAAFDKANVESLLEEAKRAFGNNCVTAAFDYYSVKVPRRGPEDDL